LAQHGENLLEAGLVNDVADAHEVYVLCGNLDGQVALGDLELEVHLLFAADDARLDVLDLGRPVVRVDDGLANNEVHMCTAPYESGPQVYHQRVRSLQALSHSSR